MQFSKLANVRVVAVGVSKPSLAMLWGSRRSYNRKKMVTGHIRIGKFRPMVEEATNCGMR